MFSGEPLNPNYINKSQPTSKSHNYYSQHFNQHQAQLPTHLSEQHQIQYKPLELKLQTEKRRALPKDIDDVVKLNVGGVLFTTTIETLYHIYYFRKLIDESTPTLFTDGYYFINRDGNLFNYIFKFVRDNEMPIVNYKSINELKKVVKEALYYQYELLSIDLNKKIEEYEKNPDKFILVTEYRYTYLLKNISNKLEQGYDLVGGVGYKGNEGYQAMRL